jgi:hypothetical protein
VTSDDVACLYVERIFQCTNVTWDEVIFLNFQNYFTIEKYDIT